jgi:hypothetical protein
MVGGGAHNKLIPDRLTVQYNPSIPLPPPLRRSGCVIRYKPLQ